MFWPNKLIFSVDNNRMINAFRTSTIITIAVSYNHMKKRTSLVEGVNHTTV